MKDEAQTHCEEYRRSDDPTSETVFSIHEYALKTIPGEATGNQGQLPLRRAGSSAFRRDFEASAMYYLDASSPGTKRGQSAALQTGSRTD